MNELRFDTKALHGKPKKKDVHNSIRYPVYAGVAFDYKTAQQMEDAFNHRKPSHTYSRITNPTVELFEQTLCLLENGFAGIALSSGMAAITNTLLALLTGKDNVIASKYLFGNTLSLLKETLKGFGVEARFVDVNDQSALESAIDENTRMIFCETITNPQMRVSDFSIVSKIAKRHDLIVVVDSSVTTPFLFDAKKHGANIVVHSTTKYISGGATSVGGAIIDLGNYDWTNNRALKKYHDLEAFAFIARLRKEVYRNFGSCMSPQAACLQTLGLETLSLRIKKSCNNAIKIAQFLENSSKIKKVNYPGLTSSEYYDLSIEQFNGLAGGIISFELAGRKEAFKFIDVLNLIRRATNINDNKSLIIHPASTIFADFSLEEKEDMEVTQGLIRLSVGIEDPRDLMEDIDRALISLT
ncbi:MAG: O-acetylhomoserine aminocarboxypropyltransferase/cysteine synthase [Deltaproteobacteria bacterium]|nr:O-acetylhomoserine aminocarboxypropyltransferase/cysteine synthase [Deltaproteobacteria bacterium]